jgi:hypothetical protein
VSETRTYQIKAEASRFHCNPDDDAEELEAIITCDAPISKAQGARILCAIHPDYNLKAVEVRKIEEI